MVRDIAIAVRSNSVLRPFSTRVAKIQPPNSWSKPGFAPPGSWYHQFRSRNSPGLLVTKNGKLSEDSVDLVGIPRKPFVTHFVQASRKKSVPFFTPFTLGFEDDESRSRFVPWDTLGFQTVVGDRTHQDGPEGASILRSRSAGRASQTAGYLCVPLCSPCLCGWCLPSPGPRPVSGSGNRRGDRSNPMPIVMPCPRASRSSYPVDPRSHFRPRSSRMELLRRTGHRDPSTCRRLPLRIAHLRQR